MIFGKSVKSLLKVIESGEHRAPSDVSQLFRCLDSVSETAEHLDEATEMDGVPPPRWFLTKIEHGFLFIRKSVGQWWIIVSLSCSRHSLDSTLYPVYK